MKFRPLYDRIVVRPQEEEEKTAGGLYIPNTAQEKPQRGVVVAVGEGYLDADRKIVPLTIKEGDTVVYGKYAASQDFKVDGETYLIMKEEDIFGVVGE